MSGSYTVFDPDLRSQGRCSSALATLTLLKLLALLLRADSQTVTKDVNHTIELRAAPKPFHPLDSQCTVYFDSLQGQERWGATTLHKAVNFEKF